MVEFNLTYLEGKSNSQLAKLQSDAQNKIDAFSRNLTHQFNLPNIQDIARFQNINEVFPWELAGQLSEELKDSIQKFANFLKNTLQTTLKSFPTEVFEALSKEIKNALENSVELVEDVATSLGDAIPIIGQAIAIIIKSITRFISKRREVNQRFSLEARDYQFYEMAHEVKALGPKYWVYSGVRQNHNYAQYQGSSDRKKGVYWRWRPWTPPLRTSTIPPFFKHEKVPKPKGSCGSGVCVRMPVAADATFYDLNEGGKVCRPQDNKKRCKSHIAFTPIFYPWIIPNQDTEITNFVFTDDGPFSASGLEVMMGLQNQLLTDFEINLRADSRRLEGMFKNFMSWWYSKTGNPKSRSRTGGKVKFEMQQLSTIDGSLLDETIEIFPKRDGIQLRGSGESAPKYFYDENGLITVNPALGKDLKKRAESDLRRVGTMLDVGYEEPLFVSASMYNTVVGATLAFFAVQNSIFKNHKLCHSIVEHATNKTAIELKGEEHLSEAQRATLLAAIERYHSSSSRNARSNIKNVLNLRGYDPAVIDRIIASAELYELRKTTTDSRVRAKTRTKSVGGRTKAKLMNTERVKKSEAYHRKLLGLQLALFAKQITMQSLPEPHGKNLGDPLAAMIQETLPAWLYIYQNRNSQPGSNKPFIDYPSKIQYEVSEHLKANWNVKDIGLPNDPTTKSLLNQLKPLFFQPIIEKSKVIAADFNEKYRLKGSLPKNEKLQIKLSEDMIDYLNQQDLLDEIDPERGEAIKNQEKDALDASKKKKSSSSAPILLAGAAAAMFLFK